MKITEMSDTGEAVVDGAQENVVGDGIFFVGIFWDFVNLFFCRNRKCRVRGAHSSAHQCKA